MTKLVKVNRLIRKLSKNKIVLWLILPLVLIFLWIALTFTFGSYKSLTVLIFPHDFSSLNRSKDIKLLKGQKVTQKFIANENNLGIVEVPIGSIANSSHAKEDVIVFKIRKEGQLKWQQINKYRVGFFKSDTYFPFGFSEFANSKEKSFEYEIESTRGSNESYVVINTSDSEFFSKYRIPIGNISSSPKNLILFTYKKISTFFTNYYIFSASLLLLFPLILYITWLFFNHKRLKIISNPFFYFAFFLLSFSVFSIWARLNVPINSISSLAYFLIVLGFIRILSGYKRKMKK